MAEVKVSVDVGANPETCYKIASEMEQFPEFMSDVEDVTVEDQGEDWTLTRWKSQFQGRPIEWVERDEFDDENLLITFEQTEGDLKTFTGRWSFADDGEGGCKIALSVEASLGIPVLSAALDPMVEKAVTENCEQMLQAIKARAEEKE